MLVCWYGILHVIVVVIVVVVAVAMVTVNVIFNVYVMVMSYGQVKSPLRRACRPAGCPP